MGKTGIPGNGRSHVHSTCNNIGIMQQSIIITYVALHNKVSKALIIPLTNTYQHGPFSVGTLALNLLFWQNYKVHMVVTAMLPVDGMYIYLAHITSMSSKHMCLLC